MVYVNRSGAVVTKAPFVARVKEFVRELWALALLFFRTIFDPAAAQHELEKRRKRQERGNGTKLGGPSGTGPGIRPGGARILGLSDFKDAGGNCAAGA